MQSVKMNAHYFSNKAKKLACIFAWGAILFVRVAPFCITMAGNGTGQQPATSRPESLQTMAG